MIAVLGSRRELQTVYLVRCLEEIGARSWVIETADFPSKVVASIGLERMRYGSVPLERVRVAYLRSTFAAPEQLGPQVDRAMRRNWYATVMASREKGNFLAALLHILSERKVRLVNPLEAQAAAVKPYQLRRLRAEGVPVPKTLVTNDPAGVRAFARECGRVIYKPVLGGATTKELLPGDLSRARLRLLRNAPVMFQELVPGYDVRVYVVGRRVVSGAIIHTDKLDFREAEGPSETIRLPAEIRELCVRAARASGLLFSGIDLKWDGGKRYTFLECNSSPMFYGHDQKTDGAVGPALARYLVSLTRR